LLFDEFFIKKPKITHRLHFLGNFLQYANSVDKEYEENNGVGFARKCWSRPCEYPWMTRATQEQPKGGCDLS
jgi:hypothetical protein